MIIIHDGANIDFIKISKIPINSKASRHSDTDQMRIWINFIPLDREEK